MALCCFLTFILFCCVANGASNEHAVYLDRLMLCLEKVVAYYKQNYAAMNLDGIYGLRVLEGQMSSLIEQLKHPIEVVQRISTLHQETSAIATAALNSLQLTDPNYLSLLRPLVDTPMTFYQPYTRLDPSLRWSGPNIQSEIGEEFSDGCMAEIIGTGGGVKCALSPACTEHMLSRGLKGYSLMHQLLYTILAEQIGCPLPVDAQVLRAAMCADSFHEMALALQTVHGNIIPVLQDLFLEEEYVCPLLGFMEFLHNDWLRQILSWQRPSGCFGTMPKSVLVEDKVANYDYEVDAAAVSHTEHNDTHHRQRRGFNVPKNRELQSEKETYYQKSRPEKNAANQRSISSRWSKRRLLEEKVLKDGCLSHKTAVALGALSQYLRFMLVPSGNDVSLGGRNYLLRANVPVKDTNNFISKRRSAKTKAEESEEVDVDYGGGGEIDLHQRNYGLETVAPQQQQLREEEQYSYYGNDEKGSDTVEVTGEIAVPDGSYFVLPGGYLITLVITCAFFMLMFRCIRHRRILIRYRHS